MVSSEARAELERMFATKKLDAQRYPEGKPLELRRRDWEAEARLQVLPKGARFHGIDAGGVHAEWVEMPHVAQDRVFLLLHGGGYNAGSSRTHRKMAANLSRAAYMRVLTPDYRLAPEHPFPAAVKDALLAYKWLLAQGFTEDNMIVGGDSAGGGLALSMLLALREGGAPMPRAAILMAPWTDLSCSSASYERLRQFDPIITKERLREAGEWYAGGRSPTDPMASPMFADLRGLPPMFVSAGADETMVDDSRIFAERAKAAGVDVTLKIYPDMWHVFQSASPTVPEAVQAMVEIGDYLRGQFG